MVTIQNLREDILAFKQKLSDIHLHHRQELDTILQTFGKTMAAKIKQSSGMHVDLDSNGLPISSPPKLPEPQDIDLISPIPIHHGNRQSRPRTTGVDTRDVLERLDRISASIEKTKAIRKPLLRMSTFETPKRHRDHSSLPRILSDDEDRRETRPGWAATPMLAKTLRMQEKIDPGTIFGQTPLKLSIDAVFNNR